MPYIKRAPGRRMEGAAINDVFTYTTAIHVYVRSQPSRIVCGLPARRLITTRDLTVFVPIVSLTLNGMSSIG
jgi:hypothetical protein